LLVVGILNVVTGLVFAWVARDRLRADGVFAPPAFLLIALHAALTVVVALYFYVVHPEWALMYFVDPAKLSGLAILPLVVGHATLVGAGWYVGAYLIRSDRKRALLYSIGGVGVVALVAIALGFERLSHAAQYLGWKHGQRLGLFDVEIGYSITVAFAALAGSIAYVLLELIRDRRRVRAR
jgi:hypothetical protein